MQQVGEREAAVVGVVVVDRVYSTQAGATLCGVKRSNRSNRVKRTASRKPFSKIAFDVTCTEPVRKSE